MCVCVFVRLSVCVCVYLCDCVYTFMFHVSLYLSLIFVVVQVKSGLNTYEHQFGLFLRCMIQHGTLRSVILAEVAVHEPKGR